MIPTSNPSLISLTVIMIYDNALPWDPVSFNAWNFPYRFGTSAEGSSAEALSLEWAPFTAPPCTNHNPCAEKRKPIASWVLLSTY
jgi:hypothetical protein